MTTFLRRAFRGTLPSVFALWHLFATGAYCQGLSPLNKAEPPHLPKGAPKETILPGKWTYRSFRSDPALSVPPNSLLFGRGTLEFSSPAGGQLGGTLGGTGWELKLLGTLKPNDPVQVRFQGRGMIDGEEWVYDYLGYVLPEWPNGIDQRPAIVRTIVRTIPHSDGQGGISPAGVVAQWIAVKQDPAAGAAADPKLPEEIRKFGGRPLLALAIRSVACSFCLKQIEAFERAAEQPGWPAGLSMVIVAPDASAAVSRYAADAHLKHCSVISDPERSILKFIDPQAPQEDRQHGLLLLSGDGKTVYKSASAEPVLDPASLAPQFQVLTSSADQEGVPLEPTEAIPVSNGARVEIEMWNTPSTKDDYITWSPTPCRIRLSSVGGFTTPPRVIVKNDPPRSAPVGRAHPLDGDLLFDHSVAPGQTARNELIALSLPLNGDWVNFVAAGKFPRASSADKDAIIEVRRDTSGGELLGSHALMVRIRKDHRTLTEHERRRFLEALDYLHRGTSGDSRYMYFVRLHRVAAWGLRFEETPIDPPPYYWPDLAHKGPGFVAWHRAFLLEFERELQVKYPDVALPYWTMPEPSALFTEDFLGYNEADDPNQVQTAKFGRNNPLFGWVADIDGSINEPIQRFRTGRDPNGPGWRPPSTGFLTDQALLSQSRFSLYPAIGMKGAFAEILEANPHNQGHNWTGPWMQNCATSPRDPIFWIFHTGFDRQWAAWQQAYGRFDPSGLDGSYCPLGDHSNPGPVCGVSTLPADCDNIDDPNPCVPITHYLNDKFWPWSGASGAMAARNRNLPPKDWSDPFSAPFKASSTPGLWPRSPESPSPSDMIDYQGSTENRLPMGFGYDDSPFPTVPLDPPSPPQLRPLDGPLAAFADKNRPLAERLEISKAFSMTRQSLTPRQAEAIRESVRSPAENDLLRGRALTMLASTDPKMGAMESVAILQGNSGVSPDLSTTAVEVLSSSLMFDPLTPNRREEIMGALERSLASSSLRVRSAGLTALASMGTSAEAEKFALDALGPEPGKTGIEPAQAIKALVLMKSAIKNAGAIRPLVAKGDVNAQTEAVLALAGDQETRPELERIMLDPQQPNAVRSAAIHSLLANGTGSIEAYATLVRDPAADLNLRGEAVASLGVLVRSVRIQIAAGDLEKISRLLGAIEREAADGIGPVVGETLLRANQRLLSPPR